MNLKKFTLVSSVALAALAVPVASAQSRGGRSSTATPSTPHITAPTGSGAGAHFANHGARPGNDTGSNRWGNHDSGWSHHHRHFYPYYSYYSGFGYPYGFGYPFGYGYGFGYPYYGASAALYYNGYGNGYRSYGYRDGGGSLVSEVQQRLARAGYYRGAIDGVIGGNTRNAIRAWERSHGLRVDGRIDNQLLSTLGIA